MTEAFRTRSMDRRVVSAKPRWMHGKAFQEAASGTIAFLIALAGSALFLFPLVWMLVSSVSSLGETYAYPPRWIPKRILLSNFPEAFKFIPYWRYMRNSAIVTVQATIGALVTSSLVAYGFARVPAPGSSVLFLLLLATMMLPMHVRLVPVYLLWRALKLTDTYVPLIAPAWMGGSPFFFFLLRQFYSSLPKALDDAARIDGCSYLAIWWRIVLPLSKPALATVAIFSFFGNWNSFLGPLIYLNDPDKYTVPLALPFFTQEQQVPELNLLMAATLVFVLPPLAVFFFAQKTFVQGIVMTGIKG